MTTTILPRTTDSDTLIAETIPWLSTVYYDEAAAYLRAQGLTDDEITKLVAEKTLGA